MKQQASEQSSRKKDKKWTLLLLLLLFFMLSNLFLLWRLGQLAEKNMGEIIDTIVLSPEQAEELPLLLCGKVQYSDGTPVVGHQVELHSTVRYDITDEDGDFSFDNVEYGEHKLILLEQDGSEKVLASLEIERNATLTDGKQIFKQKDDGVWYFQVPTETLILEFDMEIDEEGDTLTVLPESVSALMTDSWVMTYYGTAQASQEGPILTPHGSVMLTDGTIHLHVGEVILPNGTLIDTDGNVYKNGEQVSKSDLPEQYILNTEDYIVHTPDGTEIKLKEIETHFADGTVVDNQGTITKPDGTVIDNKTGTVTTPDGYQIDSDGTVTDPDGNIYEGTTLPDGSVVGEDGTLTTPDGEVIVLPKPGHGFIIEPVEEEKTPRPIEEGTYLPEASDTPTGEENGNTAADNQPADSENPSGTEEPTTPAVPENGGNITGGGTTGGGTTGGGNAGTDKDDDDDDEDEDEDEEEPQEIHVMDKETNREWRQLTTIDLFKNGGLIYPGASANYEFYVRNSVASPVRYRMTISEAEHESGALPLEYRIKDPNGYVAGTEEQWLTAAELEDIWVTINVRGNLHYTLEWRWPYESGADENEIKVNDQKDVSLGNAENREHLIQVEIYAESIY